MTLFMSMMGRTTSADAHVGWGAECVAISGSPRTGLRAASSAVWLTLPLPSAASETKTSLSEKGPKARPRKAIWLTARLCCLKPARAIVTTTRFKLVCVRS